MKRFEGNPILTSVASHPWESRRIFNAAILHNGNRVHMLYRAMGDDAISRLGYATTQDGYHIDWRSHNPVFVPATDVEKDGCEDPRLTLLDDKLYMCYTALSVVDNQDKYQISLTSISVDDLVRRRWTWGERQLPFPGIRNKDGVIFPKRIDGKVVMFHRLEPDICAAYSADFQHWYDVRSVMPTRTKSWDCWKVGAAGTPIELNEGWLFIYHGVSYEKVYRLGVALLDRYNPEIIRWRADQPILEPVEEYEKFGKVPNVVFSCGNALIDDRVIVYYGAADSVLCVATYDLSELLPKK